MSDVKWIKVCTNIFDDEKMLLIDTLPKSDTILVIWFKLLCLAGKINNGGVFLLNDNIPYSVEMLSKIFRRKKTTVENAIKVFEEYGLIEIVDDVITVPNWGKHQSLDSIEKKKEYMKTYMQEYREKQKDKACKTNRKTNSKSNVSRTDKEEDKNKKKNKEVYFPDDENLNAAFKDFVDYRKSIKKPMGERAIELNKKDLEKLSAGDSSKAIAIINQSIKRGWQGLFPLKGDDNYGPSNTGNTRADEDYTAIDETIRRIESGEADHDDDGLWD